MASAAEVGQHVQVLKTSDDAQLLLQSLNFIFRDVEKLQQEGPRSCSHFLPHNLQLYVKLGKKQLNNVDIQLKVLELLEKARLAEMLIFQSVMRFVGAFEWVFKVLTPESPLPLFEAILKFLPLEDDGEDECVKMREEFLRLDAIEVWGSLISKLPRDHPYRAKLANCLRHFVLTSNTGNLDWDLESTWKKVDEPNIQNLWKICKFENGETFSKGEFDAFDSTLRVNTHFWRDLLVTWKELVTKSQTVRVGVKFEILEIVGTNLASKDNNGFSDPFIVFSRSIDKKALWKSSVQKKNLNPRWEFGDKPVVVELEDIGQGLYATVWDDDLLGKDFMGQINLGPIGELALQMESGKDKFTVYYSLSDLEGTKKHKNIKGSISLTYRITISE